MTSAALGRALPRRRLRRWPRGLRARLAEQAAEIARLDAERATLLERMQTRSDELDVATRMLAARARTMTSVIDAVTEQSIIGTDRDGVIRVWNPGAEKMLGLLRADVVRKRSIVEFHAPDELAEAAADAGCEPGLAALVHAAQENGSDVRDWTYVAADGAPSRWRSPRAPTTAACTPAGTSSAPT
jgi:PAS domain-containing protein